MVSNQGLSGNVPSANMKKGSGGLLRLMWLCESNGAIFYHIPLFALVEDL